MNEYNTLKLCDFGLSKKLTDLVKKDEDGENKPKSGTPYYMAPELFSDDGVYSFYSDMWALGVVLFTMLYGQFPFYDSVPQELFSKIKSAEYTIPDDGRVSEDTKSVIRKLLLTDPSKRLTASEVRIK